MHDNLRMQLLLIEGAYRLMVEHFITDCYLIQFTVVLVIVGFFCFQVTSSFRQLSRKFYRPTIALLHFMTFLILAVLCCAGCVLGLILVHLAVAYVSVYRCICLGLLVCVSMRFILFFSFL